MCSSGEFPEAAASEGDSYERRESSALRLLAAEQNYHSVPAVGGPQPFCENGWCCLKFGPSGGGGGRAGPKAMLLRVKGWVTTLVPQWWAWGMGIVQSDSCTENVKFRENWRAIEAYSQKGFRLVVLE